MKSFLSVIFLLAAPCFTFAGPLQLFVLHDSSSTSSTAIKDTKFDIDGYRSQSPDMEIYELIGTRLSEGNNVTYNSDGKIESQSKSYDVTLDLKPEDQRHFHTLTEAAVGKRIIIEIDGNIIYAPTVHMAIDSPSILITHHNKDDAERLLSLLRPLITTKSKTEQGAAANP